MAAAFSHIDHLRLENITKRFPHTLACDHITLDVGRGEILALIGENGAGKTTLMNILMGIYIQDEGKIFINGQEAVFHSPSDALNCGIGMVHQQYMLVPEMTVTENIALGMKNVRNAENKGGLSGLRSAFRLDLAFVRKRIEEVSAFYGLTVDPDAYIWQLSVGEQQKVELVKTLCLGAKFLILDEPASALTPQETDELIELLKRMSEKISMIFISHKLAEVKALCDKMVILRKGTLVYAGNTADHTAENIAELMTGHEVDLNVNRPAKNIGEALLEIRDLSVESDRGNLSLDRLNLTVRAGEIMGLAGVSGNGQKELAEAISGLRGVKEGRVLFDGTDLVGKTPPQIIRMGLMSYIPEERNEEGIVPGMSIKENFVLKDIGKELYSHRNILKKKKIAQNAEELCDRFDIRAANQDVLTGSLSGGNIQKVILAREISRDPRFLVAVYPIRGLDMGAAEFIHHQLLDLRDQGVGILLISEEIEEVMNLSDRIAVIFKGNIHRVLEKNEATQRKLGILMAGGDKAVAWYYNVAGLIAAMVAGALMELLFGVVVIRYNAPQGIAGIGMQFFCTGLAGSLYRNFIGEAEGVAGINAWKIPLLSRIPVLGNMLFSCNPMVYVSFLMVPLVSWIMKKTPWGLRVRACGLMPRAADTMGVNVHKTRYQALAFGSALAGLAGAYMSLCYAKSRIP